MYYCYSIRVELNNNIMNYKPKTFRLPLEDIDALNEFARNLDLNTSQLIRRMIKEYLENNKTA